MAEKVLAIGRAASRKRLADQSLKLTNSQYKLALRTIGLDEKAAEITVAQQAQLKAAAKNILAAVVPVKATGGQWVCVFSENTPEARKAEIRATVTAMPEVMFFGSRAEWNDLNVQAQLRHAERDNPGLDF